MEHSPGSWALALMWKSRKKLPAPGLGLAHSQAFFEFGGEIDDGIPLSPVFPSFSASPPSKPVKYIFTKYRITYFSAKDVYHLMTL